MIDNFKSAYDFIDRTMEDKKIVKNYMKIYHKSNKHYKSVIYGGKKCF